MSPVIVCHPPTARATVGGAVGYPMPLPTISLSLSLSHRHCASPKAFCPLLESTGMQKAYVPKSYKEFRFIGYFSLFSFMPVWRFCVLVYGSSEVFYSFYQFNSSALFSFYVGFWSGFSGCKVNIFGSVAGLIEIGDKL